MLTHTGIQEPVDPFAAVDSVAIAKDLRTLLRGPGAQPGQEPARIGSALRAMCGIATADHIDEAIAATAAWLRKRVASLGTDQQTLLLLAFGLHETTQLLAARARFKAAADYLGRSEATARRHVGAAIGALARTTSVRDSIPHQLRRHAGQWVHIDFVADQSHVGVTTRCFLTAVSRVVNQPD